MADNKICLVIDEDFAIKHIPPYPKPSFIAFENPFRIRVIVDYLKKLDFFSHQNISVVKPKDIDEAVLELTHSHYHIDSIKRITDLGGGLLDDEVFISEDTYDLAKQAVGGAIKALEVVLNGSYNQSFALIRPPGHHAFKDKASGLCIFNNIATAIVYLRTHLNFQGKIAIVDIDDHFGDGLANFFYEDPSVLYFSVHEFDFTEGDLGLMDEFGYGEGIGTNINVPLPPSITNQDFIKIFDLLKPILYEFNPSLIIVAAGFDMYFADPIGNCNLTSKAYYNFTQELLTIAEGVCNGKIAFILEGGYSLVGLPYCVKAILKGLLKEEYEPPEFENGIVDEKPYTEEVTKIIGILKKILIPFWDILKK